MVSASRKEANRSVEQRLFSHIQSPKAIQLSQQKNTIRKQIKLGQI